VKSSSFAFGHQSEAKPFLRQQLKEIHRALIARLALAEANLKDHAKTAFCMTKVVRISPPFFAP
jgi:hypothetical protein